MPVSNDDLRAKELDVDDARSIEGNRIGMNEQDVPHFAKWKKYHPLIKKYLQAFILVSSIATEKSRSFAVKYICFLRSTGVLKSSCI